VEHNNFCVSAHFRNCATENWQKVVVAVNESVAAQQAQLHVTRGRKVLEVRPQVSAGSTGCIQLRTRSFCVPAVMRMVVLAHVDRGTNRGLCISCAVILLV
jgi:hypothetical protein